MNWHLRKTVSAIALGVLGALPATSEDLTIVSKVVEQKAKTTAISTQYVSTERTRIAMGDHDFIMEAATNKITIIDHKQRVFYELSAIQASEWLDQLDKLLKGVPGVPDDVLSGAVGSVVVTKGTTTKTIAGNECEQYTLAVGSATKVEIWVARGLQVPAYYYDAVKMPVTLGGFGNFGRRLEKVYREIKQIGGVPLFTSISMEFMGQQFRTETEATDVKMGPIPASVFEVPTGYKKKSWPPKG